MSSTMKETCGMYTMKRAYPAPKIISVSNDMYKMKNVHKIISPITELDVGHDKNEVEELEERQEKILSKLEELQKQLQDIRSNTKQKVTVKSNSQIKFIPQTGMMHDIVIKANPKYPPLSLLVLYNLLKKNGKIGMQCLIHSSVTFSLDENLKNLFPNDLTASRSQTDLFFTLIWTDSSNMDPEMIINPMTQIAIAGEVNILRYLSNYIQLPNSQTDILRLTDVDSVLDLVHSSLIHGNTKERQSVVRILNSRLGKNPWVNGDAITIADIVAWSGMKRCGFLDGAPSNIKKWALNVEKLK